MTINRYWKLISYLCFLGLLIQVSTREAHAYTVELVQLVEGSSQPNSQWQGITANPKSIHDYYIYNRQGQIFAFSDNQVSGTPLLDIKQHYPNSQFFNSFALHPNFAVPQSKGSLTFYTLHVEESDQEVRTARIKTQLQQKLPYEIVIAEWQLNEVNNNKIKQEVKREVIRVPLFELPSKTFDFKFNPFAKSWHDNFGHLYIAIPSAKHESSPSLYSGAIIRINPEKFGLRSYTIPQNNPFISNKDYADEILITGIEQLNQFSWLKTESNVLVISSQKNGINELIKVPYGTDLKNTNELTLLRTSEATNSLSSAILYRGKALSNLRNQLLFLEHNNGQWLLIAIETNPPINEQIVESFDRDLLSGEPQLTMHTTLDDELIFLDTNSGAIYSSFINTHTSKNQEPTPAFIIEPEEQNSSSHWVLLFLMLCLGGASFVWYKKNNQESAKTLLNKSFCEFKLSKDKAALYLFDRHQEEHSKQILISQIAKSEVYLNGQLILSIEKELSGFDSEIEQRLQEHFNNEKRHKMVDHRVRKIILILTDADDNNFPICLYLREGNLRLTKPKFSQITEDVINWCWFIAKELAPEKTGKRIIKATPVPVTSTVAHGQQKANGELDSSSAQVNKNIQTKPQKAPFSVDNATNTNAINKVSTENQKREIQSEKGTNSTTATTKQQAQKLDTELITALEKLAHMKQQGLLSEQEFQSAKTKILKDLTE